MRIDRLTVENLRILTHLDLRPGRGINLIIGGNGAGKTSVLEAIYLAGRGRTFRHQVAGPLIRDGESETTVVVRFEGSKNDEDGDASAHILGMRRGRSGMQCRLDGSDVTKRSTLVASLPTQWISSQPQGLLEGSPGNRRRFFDMGLFHVEHAYLSAYAEMTRILKQRNALLKVHDPRGLDSWDRPFVHVAQQLHSFREPYIRALFDQVLKIIEPWQLGISVDWLYRPGWDESLPLLDQLHSKREQDLRHGFTHVGPQRAEIDVTVAGRVVDRTLSRGQLKMVVFALHLAQLDLLAQNKGIFPVLLVDDLGAELDLENQRRVICELFDRPNQVFVTGISTPPIDGLDSVMMFHVEHGEIRTQSRQESTDKPANDTSL